MEDLKNCRYDPEDDEPQRSGRGWWWVLAGVILVAVLVVWVKWPQSDKSAADAGAVPAAVEPGPGGVRPRAVAEADKAMADKAAADHSGGKLQAARSAPDEKHPRSEDAASKEITETKAEKPSVFQRHADEGKDEANPDPDDKPRYEFYTLLQEQEVVVPLEEIERHRPETPTLKPGVYVLQTGSFRTRAQAEKGKARLAKHGIEASIQAVHSADGQTWFRVRIGPYMDPDELRTTREMLFDWKIDSIPIRLRKR